MPGPNPSETLTIGIAARRTGLTAKAIRLYEQRGLLSPVPRTASGYREYTEHDLQLLRFVRRARAVGLSLDEIHRVIELRRDGMPPSEDVVALLETRLQDIDRTVSELEALRRGLAEVLHTAQSTIDRGDAVRLCRIMDGRANGLAPDGSPPSRAGTPRPPAMS